jgi:hypothetical protein
MPPRPRRTSRAVRSVRRRTTWATTDQNVALTAGSGSNIDLWATSLETAGGVSIGTTVLRTLFTVHVRSFNAVADQLACGIIMDDKSFVGVATPLAGNPDRDWMFYTKFYGHHSGAGVDISEFFPTTGMPFDIRSRRVNKDMGRTCMLALTNQSPITSLTVDVFVRQLVALP